MAITCKKRIEVGFTGCNMRGDKKMKKKLYIIGAGSVGGHIALNMNEYSKKFEVMGFFDDDPAKIGTEQFGFKVLGGINKVLQLKNAAIVIDRKSTRLNSSHVSISYAVFC